MALVGHPKCNRGTMLATSGGRAVDVLTGPPLYEGFLEEFRNVSFDRRNVAGTARRVIGSALSHPCWLPRGGAFLARKLWELRRELWRRELIGKIIIFVHNFMDAAALDPERIRNRSFMVMTAEAPGFDVRAQRPQGRVHPEARSPPGSLRQPFLSADRTSPPGRKRRQGRLRSRESALK
jgi:hypothetical protein